MLSTDFHLKCLKRNIFYFFKLFAIEQRTKFDKLLANSLTSFYVIKQKLFM